MVDPARLLVTFQLVAILILMTSLCPAITDAEALNHYILDYQPLTFNPLQLEEKHERVRRNADPYLHWNFKAYGRTFHLRLEPAKSMFASGHQLDDGDHIQDTVDTSFIYEGVVSGSPTSLVHMSIHNGSVSGFIQEPGHTTYHMEPAQKYFKEPKFPSIIYPESRMNLDPYRHKRAAASAHEGSCFTRSIYAKLEEMSKEVDSSKKKKRDLSSFEMNNPYAKYTASSNSHDRPLHRTRRDLTPDKTTCFMSIRADQILYQHIKSKEGDNEERAKKALVSMFALHVAALNQIYSSTEFKLKNQDKPVFRGIRFQLKRMTIIKDCDTKWNSGYCTDNLDASNFLDLTSYENHDTFCLVHTFTYRDFVGGTLGLAWVAKPSSRASGVCGVYGRVSDNGRITSKSLNTGITTLINFNREVASRVSQLTFAHEVGHNFGAEHDASSECAPYGTSRADSSDGNYIMYPSANSGSLPHNDHFSACSKDYIAKVLQEMAPNGPRKYCFEESDASFCGDNIVEDKEECDCGYADECTDKCCNARPNEGESGDMCKRSDTVVCSPSEGPCCNADCQFTGSGVCLSASQCAQSSTCASGIATCPEPQKKTNFETFCDDYDRVCVDGGCIGSVCQHINWTECFKKESEVSANEEMCYVSCQKDAGSECISSFDTAKVNQPAFADFKELLQQIQNGKKINDSDSLGVKRMPGSNCNYGKGYCDIFSKCRNYDAEGPFRQLAKLIFDPVTFENIKDWAVEHWWAVLLIALGVMVFMVVFVKLLGYNTPSEDPKKKRRAQPMPRVNPNANKRGGARGQGQGGVYATDLPMHDNQPYGSRGQGQVNQGYQGYQDYQQPHSSQYGGVGHNGRGSHQQFDRIAGPRKY